VSENAKLPDKRQDFLSLPRESESAPRSGDSDTPGEPSHMQDVEAQMRRALGLFGAPRRQDQDRPSTAPAARQQDRFSPGGHAHKRRFVQDGEVPVTVLHGRREHPAPDAPTNRLEAAETALSNEHALREKAERALAEANAAVHDLRTKLGHASLAQQELQEANRRDQETIASLRAELREAADRLADADAGQGRADERLAAAEQEFAAERDSRLVAERALRAAEDAREDAERLLRDLDLNNDGPIDLPARRPGRPPRVSVVGEEAKPHIAARTRPVVGEEPKAEPVQWWLLPEKKAKRR
jgi:hypothetical protein